MEFRRDQGHGAVQDCSMPPFPGERDVLRGLMRRFGAVRAEAARHWEAVKAGRDRWSQCADLRRYVLAVRRCGTLKDQISKYFESATGVSGGARPGGSCVTDADADLFRVDTAAAPGRAFFLKAESGKLKAEIGERRTA